jgi:hypothetical protein
MRKLKRVLAVPYKSLAGTADVELHIDREGLLTRPAHRAMRNKSGEASVAFDCVKVKAHNRKRTGT